MNNKGYTLTEVIITIVIIMILLAICFFSSFMGYQQKQMESNALSETRLAVSALQSFLDESISKNQLSNFDNSTKRNEALASMNLTGELEDIHRIGGVYYQSSPRIENIKYTASNGITCIYDLNKNPSYYISNNAIHPSLTEYALKNNKEFVQRLKDGDYTWKDHATYLNALKESEEFEKVTSEYKEAIGYTGDKELFWNPYSIEIDVNNPENTITILYATTHSATSATGGWRGYGFYIDDTLYVLDDPTKTDEKSPNKTNRPYVSVADFYKKTETQIKELLISKGFAPQQ